ncbi:MAG: hydrolase [Oscillospiraceae bacterium]|nr:hydrolase [Oscillospiraceae bacterium]
MKTPEFQSKLRRKNLAVPEVISQCSGIKIFGQVIRSVLFSTDVSIIRNTNADAIIAVYPFTPQSAITQAIMMVADKPVFVGVGGGMTQGERVVNIALNAEHQGAIGVVVNAPITNQSLSEVKERVEIPVIVTVVREDEDIAARIQSGADIFNVSGAGKTADIVRRIRRDFPDAAIIATGGNSDDNILRTIEAGANAITWTPPSNAELFRGVMEDYRNM